MEGNFAFARSTRIIITEPAGIYRSFPGNPQRLEECKFYNLRAEGAVLVSGKIENEKLITVKLFSEKGGVVNVKLPKGKIQLAESKNAKAEF
jgi:alpha-L-fucosidase 2